MRMLQYVLRKILNILKKLLYISLILFLILYLLTEPWREDGTCDQRAKVSFRGINFQFPLKVGGVLKVPMRGFSRYNTQLQTDCINGEDISAKWFFEWDYGLSRAEGITDTVKKQLVYGVAFELHEDSCKTDQEIVAEIQNIYPGNYSYVEKSGMRYYKFERDCLTIFVKRTYQYPDPYSIPEVSFCYGLDESQASIYGLYTGFINGYPD